MGRAAIVGYRVDDSYFSFARSFLENTITLEQLSYAMRLGDLGEQFVIKSQKAFDEIKFISFVPVNHKEYYPKRKTRDEEARAAYRRELERSGIRGVYMISNIICPCSNSRMQDGRSLGNYCERIGECG